MQNADIDKNGEITYSEWIMASSNMSKLVTEEKLETAFRFFDKDENGYISMQELKEVLGMKNLVSENVWNQLIQEGDENFQNKDGQISKNEFKKMMQKLVKKGGISKEITPRGSSKQLKGSAKTLF